MRLTHLESVEIIHLKLLADLYATVHRIGAVRQPPGQWKGFPPNPRTRPDLTPPRKELQ